MLGNHSKHRSEICQILVGGHNLYNAVEKSTKYRRVPILPEILRRSTILFDTGKRKTTKSTQRTIANNLIFQERKVSSLKKSSYV